MDTQIIRIPIKYWELINTMDDIECWKLMKALFKKQSDWLEWLTLTYYNIIIVDINNIENQVNAWKKWWKKWWRPRKEKPLRLLNKKPPLFKKNNPSKDKISKDNINKENNIIDKSIIKSETFWNEEINNMQLVIKETIENNWMIYKPWKYERARIKNILEWKDFWKTCEKVNMSRKDFVINIINLASRLQYAKPINNWADLYYNYAEVYNKALKTKNEFLTPKRQIW